MNIHVQMIKKFDVKGSPILPPGVVTSKQFQNRTLKATAERPAFEYKGFCSCYFYLTVQL